MILNCVILALGIGHCMGTILVLKRRLKALEGEVEELKRWRRSSAQESVR